MTWTVAACTGPDGVDPNPNWTPPEIEVIDGVRHVRNGAPEYLHRVESELHGTGRELLFMRSYATVRGHERTRLWADREAGRVVEVDASGVIRRIFQGAPSGAPPPTQPTFVAVTEDGVVAIEPDGRGLRYEGIDPVEWLNPAAEVPLHGGADTPLAGSRTILEFSLGPVQPDEPLLVLGDSERTRGIGRVQIPDGSPFLGHLVNTGWTAADGRGRVYFASAVRPELHAYSEEGDLLWVSTWRPPTTTETPWLENVDGRITPRFAVYQYGVALDRRGRIHVLAAPDPDRGPDHLLTFDADGRLRAEGVVRERSGVFVSPDGVTTVPPEEVFARTGDTPRAEFPDTRLARLTGGDSIGLSEFRGRVTVVNFWASWCAPCRKEMPALADYARTTDPSHVAIVGFNEDAVPADALAFLEQLGGSPYPHGQGEGRLRSRYNYRGLPYTVVLDGEGRLVRGFYGFGDTVDPIRAAVEAELLRAGRAEAR